MVSSQRQKRILEYLSDHDFRSIKDISEKFSISMNTARRDIDELVKSGAVSKFYGGVSLIRQGDSSFDLRNSSNISQKKAIAAFVGANLIENEDLIYIDSGSTCAMLLDYINPAYDLTIATNNLNAIEKASHNPKWQIIVIGSSLRHSSHSFINVQNWDYLNLLNLSKAFLGATGLTIRSGATNSNTNEAMIKSNMMKRSKTTYLVTDASKFGKTSLVTFARIEDFDHIITSGDVPQDMIEYLAANGIKFTNTKEEI